jgi:hypothetical protein
VEHACKNTVDFKRIKVCECPWHQVKGCYERQIIMVYRCWEKEEAKTG